MLFWILVIVVTAIACAALYYAARGRTVNATGDVVPDLTTDHFRQQLREIETDAAAGRLGAAEAAAARGEVARELLRNKSAGAGVPTAVSGRAGPLLMLSLLAVAALAFGAYGFLGSPGLPSAPLATRVDRAVAEIDIDDAVTRIEAQLARTPNDLRGWTVIAPVYMQTGRFADAARAFRRIIELGGATADAETDLGEALMMANGGSLEGEPLALFQSAVARDPGHVRSRYYLAGQATEAGDYERAVALWNELLALSQGDEPWLAAAQGGLEVAKAGLAGDLPETPDTAAIEGMVEGLAARLASDGGSIEEWTRLVRSRLVLGQTAAAQQDYEAARAAFPDPATRTELDVLAADHGLIAKEAEN
ncbi:c-type cytochrome biogenesis protein CcmI [Devosia sp.]|uniref:c-type cytochrome biogenesis protein CcmI n=1 Tax=Devosia sp. TaxID=1871048 RepID=UPI002F022F2A